MGGSGDLGRTSRSTFGESPRFREGDAPEDCNISEQTFLHSPSDVERILEAGTLKIILGSNAGIEFVQCVFADDGSVAGSIHPEKNDLFVACIKSGNDYEFRVLDSQGARIRGNIERQNV